jgi:hypothetical protein
MDLLQGLATRAESLLEKIDGAAARGSAEEDEQAELEGWTGGPVARGAAARAEVGGSGRSSRSGSGDRDDSDSDRASRTSRSSGGWRLQAVADRLQSAMDRAVDRVADRVVRSVTPVSAASGGSGGLGEEPDGVTLAGARPEDAAGVSSFAPPSLMPVLVAPLQPIKAADEAGSPSGSSGGGGGGSSSSSNSNYYHGTVVAAQLQRELLESQQALSRANEALSQSSRAEQASARRAKEAERELRGLQEAAQSYEEDYSALERTNAELEQRLAAAQQQLHESLKRAASQNAADLSRQLVEAQEVVAAAHRDGQERAAECELRLAQLEEQNAELSRELALRVRADAAAATAAAAAAPEQGRESAAASAAAATASASASASAHSVLASVPSSAAAASVALALAEAERARDVAQERCAAEVRRGAATGKALEAARVEADRAQERLAQAEARHLAEAEQWRSEAARAARELEQARRAQNEQGVAALEQRLAVLTEHLVAKQRQADLLASEKGALRQRLQQAEAMLQAQQQHHHEQQRLIQQQQQQQKDPGFVSSPLDVEAGGRVRRRNHEPLHRRIARLGPLARNEAVARAFDHIDQAALVAGDLVMREPLARLLFVAYLSLLHLWLLYGALVHRTTKLVSPTASPAAAQVAPDLLDDRGV